MDNQYMKGLIADFSNHLRKAVEIGSNTEFQNSERNFTNIVVCGLGGSGIGGTNIQKILEKELSIPLLTNKGYHLPSFVNSSSLVICCSYSGNTEETLSMYDEAKSKGAEIAVVCSGGKFEKIAKSNGLNHIVIPGGLPPRAAFGLAFPQLFFVLNKYALINDDPISQLNKAIALLDAEEENIKKDAEGIAKFLYNKLPVLYAEDRWEGVLVRWRQQINENSKMLCWHHVIPELNHNELVGWREKNDQLAVLLFKDSDDFYRNRSRFDYTQEIIEKYTSSFKEVGTRGNSFLEKAVYLIHLGDWVSYILAELKQVDSVEVDVIGGLKDMLADLK